MSARAAIVAAGVLAAAACGHHALAPEPVEPPRIALPVAEDAPPSPPDPAPTAAPAAPAPAPKPVRRPGAFANLDPDDDYVVAPPDPVEDCEGELARAGVTYRAARLAVHEQGRITCGAPQVVTYLRGPGKIAYSSPPLLACEMALALASFERVAQEEARRILGAPIVRIEHLGTYNCREMAAYPGWVSEHAYANAIDLSRFFLADGRAISVERDFDKTEGEPRKAAGLFLRVVSRRANDEDIFSHVLTPFFDAHHKNHFHLDLARYRSDGTRP